MDGQVSIFWKWIRFDVVLPSERLMWEFASAFGDFAIQNVTSADGSMLPPEPIDGYFFQGGWHTLVKVTASEEEHFYDFLSAFCEGQGISIKEEDLQPANTFLAH